MGIEEILGERRGDILQIAARHGARNVRVFGSVARGEAGADSDLDLLVDAGPERSAFFPAGLVAEVHRRPMRERRRARVAPPAANTRARPMRCGRSTGTRP